MRISAKEYTGNGADDRNLTHDIVGAAVGVAFASVGRRDSGNINRFRTPSYVDDLNSPYGGATNANDIQRFPTNGATEDVQIGSASGVNGNTNIYELVTILKDAGYIDYGSYAGTGVAKDIAVSLGGDTPAFVFVKGDRAGQGCCKTDTMGAGDSIDMDGAPTMTTGITAFAASKFSIGTNVKVNENGTTYYWVAFRKKSGSFSTFTWTGDGNDNRNIAHGLGASPVWAWAIPIQTSVPVHRPSSISSGTDETMHFTSTGSAADRIQTMDGTNIQVGTAASVNISGRAYHGIVFGDLDESTVGGGGRLSLLGVGR